MWEDFQHRESIRSRTRGAWSEQVRCADLACAMLKTLGRLELRAGPNGERCPVHKRKAWPAGHVA